MANVNGRLRRWSGSNWDEINPATTLTQVTDKGDGASSILKMANPGTTRWLYASPSGFVAGDAANIRSNFNMSKSDHHTTEHVAGFLANIAAETYNASTTYDWNAIVAYNGNYYRCNNLSGSTGNAPSGDASNNTYWDYEGVGTPSTSTMLSDKVDLVGGKVPDSVIDIAPDERGMKFQGTIDLSNNELLRDAFETTGRTTPDWSTTIVPSTDEEAQALVGAYWIVSAGGGSITETGGADQNIFLFDDTHPKITGTSSLDAGDWIVIKSVTVITEDTYYEFKFDVISNTENQATDSVRGVVQLSNGQTQRSGLADTHSGTKIVDEKTLRDVLRDGRLGVTVGGPTYDAKTISSFAATSGGLPPTPPDNHIGYVGSGTGLYDIYTSSGGSWSDSGQDENFPLGLLEDMLIYDAENQITYIVGSASIGSATGKSCVADDLEIQLDN